MLIGPLSKMSFCLFELPLFLCYFEHLLRFLNLILWELLPYLLWLRLNFWTELVVKLLQLKNKFHFLRVVKTFRYIERNLHFLVFFARIPNFKSGISFVCVKLWLREITQLERSFMRAKITWLSFSDSFCANILSF